VDEVGADEELCTSIGDGANGVCVPDFLEEAFSHDIRCSPGFAAGGEIGWAKLECQSRMRLWPKETSGFDKKTINRA
jgi:hypothetical protein